jgi:hypothetical protein
VLLCRVVETLGSDNWQAVAAQIPGRKARQCRDRWLNYLSPAVVNGRWTPAEDDLLRAKYDQFGTTWKHIAAFFPSRTDINVRSRWQVLQRRAKKQAAAQQPSRVSPPAPCTLNAPESRDSRGVQDGDGQSIWGSLMMREDDMFDTASDPWLLWR